MFPWEPRQVANRRQRADDAEGRFFDRLWVFPFDPQTFVDRTTTTEAELSAMSQGARHIRVLALRAVLVGLDNPTATPTALDTAQLRLRLQLNGSDWATDEIGGQDVSFAILCTKKSPWYWFEGPLIVRSGDLLHATVRAAPRAGEAVGLLPALSMRVMDARLYDRLYERALARRLGRTDQQVARAVALGLVDEEG
jgi:hypothetical protein